MPEIKALSLDRWRIFLIDESKWLCKLSNDVVKTIIREQKIVHIRRLLLENKIQSLVKQQFNLWLEKSYPQLQNPTMNVDELTYLIDKLYWWLS
jgi:hypothetical protein